LPGWRARAELEDVLAGSCIRWRVGASRTDAGVHAQGQVATVRSTSPIPIENVARAVEARASADLAVLRAEVVAPDFHPSRAARSKLYRYRIAAVSRRPAADPAGHFTWHVWHPLDPDRLRAAAGRLIGTHDFAGFASQGGTRGPRRCDAAAGVRRHHEGGHRR
jgi:tRNA pseudouridine38-40 synthase